MNLESNTGGTQILATVLRLAERNLSALRERSGQTSSHPACGKPMDVTESTVRILSSAAAGTTVPADALPTKPGANFKSVLETVKVFPSVPVMHSNAVATHLKKTA